MKNGLGVAVPGTGMMGLPIAAAIGALGGNPDGGLEVLKHITSEQVTAAKNMLEQKLVSVDIHQTEHILYSESTLFADNDYVESRNSRSAYQCYFNRKKWRNPFSESGG